MNVLAIIPARKNSKGVPGKNFKKYLDVPLIDYTIDAALKSKLITKTILSTDWEEIIEYSRKYKTLEIQERPKELATDQSPIIHTIIEIIKGEKFKPDYIMILQPTSPIRDTSDIDNCIQKMQMNNKFNSLISVIPMDDIHPTRMYWQDTQDQSLESIMPKHENSLRQDIPTAYYRNGSIYITRTDSLLKNHSIINKPIASYEMKYSHWLNIDDLRDDIIANSLIKAWKEGII